LNENEFLEVLQKIKAEKNSIISKFDEIKISSKNAYESQALLELYNNYCAKKLCLQCAVGVRLLSEK
jgi:hypothetical protein